MTIKPTSNLFTRKIYLFSEWKDGSVSGCLLLGSWAWAIFWIIALLVGAPGYFAYGLIYPVIMTALMALVIYSDKPYKGSEECDEIMQRYWKSKDKAIKEVSLPLLQEIHCHGSSNGGSHRHSCTYCAKRREVLIRLLPAPNKNLFSSADNLEAAQRFLDNRKEMLEA